ncbi:hypothetical protein AB0D49_27435 [Streptomyces sp. NPDC048290]|uniref:hypothetical protein n=1 Tax=Streptomyces sp. NPDC048290 TaxID=3155811 RepID=UPI0034325301
MLRGLVHVLAWSLATGAAVTLSWWGVHTVMVATAYDPPRALPLAVSAESGGGTPSPDPPATPEPRADSAPSTAPGERPAPARTPRSASPTPTTSAPAPSPPSTSPPAVSDTVKSFDTEGGRAVFAIGAASATLVSATPGPNWSMQVWKLETWIRVEFSSGAERVSVFCTWHDGPPRVEVGTY